MRASDISTQISIGLIILLAFTFIAVPFATHSNNSITGHTISETQSSGDVPRTMTEYKELLTSLIHKVENDKDVAPHHKQFLQYAQSKGVNSLSEKDIKHLEQTAKELDVDVASVISSYGEDERKGYIIELEGKAAIKRKDTGNKISSHAVNSQKNLHERAKSDIRNIKQDYGLTATASKSASDIRSFKRVYNGLATRLSDNEVKRVKSLSYIESVQPNRKRKILLNESIPQVGAVEVRNIKGPKDRHLFGDNITIAVIDTGVDYTHPSLGNCTTDEFLNRTCEKVIDGYDFYNEDDDPLDDNGHGTHCSSIAAGNGTLDGVAPNAKIVAYKVLSSGGSGYEDDILAGIERAVDPNMDFNTSDHYDIISMSLGGSGNPDDTLSTAIDNAAEAGVVPAVAAGNDGPALRMISSPACARDALTVGATCKDSQVGENDYCDSKIPWFSSRGPAYGYSKPDISAPGVEVCAARASVSSAPNENPCPQGYIAHSGTSMATPHVAGATALLLQKHPEWTPSQIKSAFTMTADDMGFSDIKQGHGEINIRGAVALDTPPVAEIHGASNTYEE